MNRADFTRTMGFSLVLNEEEQLRLRDEGTAVLVHRCERVGNLKACLPNNELTSYLYLREYVGG